VRLNELPCFDFQLRVCARFRVAAALCSLAVLHVLLAQPAPAAEKTEVIAGAGPSTKIVKEYVKILAVDPRAKDYALRVPEESVKHQGGIENADSFIFGRTGRVLNDKERAAGYAEILLAKMPIVFVAGSKAGVRTLTTDQVCGIYTGKVANWKEVGGNDERIVLINREPTEAMLQQLKKDLPCLTHAVETKFVLKNDDHLVEMLKTMEMGQAAIGFGAAANFPETIRLKVEGLDSAERLGLVYKAANRSHPLVQAAIETAASGRWLGRLKELGYAAP
jgi:phosphate transport system substrate-binding protein